MYQYPVTVEFEDIDSYNIAHHTKIIAYLERARVHFFNDNGFDLQTLDHGLVLVNMDINFKRPLLMLDKVIIELAVSKIDRVRFTWDYTIKKDDRIAVKAYIEQAVIDIASKRLINIPEKTRQLLETIIINRD